MFCFWFFSSAAKISHLVKRSEEQLALPSLLSALSAHKWNYFLVPISVHSRATFSRRAFNLSDLETLFSSSFITEAAAPFNE